MCSDSRWLQLSITDVAEQCPCAGTESAGQRNWSHNKIRAITRVTAHEDIETMIPTGKDSSKHFPFALRAAGPAKLIQLLAEYLMWVSRF